MKTPHLVLSFNLFHTLLNNNSLMLFKKKKGTQYKDAKKPTHYATTFSPEYCTNPRVHQNLSSERLITKTTNKPQTYDLRVFKASVIFVNSGI